MSNDIEKECKVIKVINETPDTKTIRLALDKPLLFKPGQFIMLSVNLPGKDKPEKRAYSIASSPTQKDYLEITVKKMPHGVVSRYLVEEVTEGQHITIKGPYGRFTFDDEHAKEIVMIAAGTGCAPMRSIQHYIKDKNFSIKTTLFFSVKTEKDIIYKKELEELSKDKNIDYILTLTRSDKEWTGEKGRLTVETIKKHSANPDYYFICGPPSMVNDIREQLIKNNVPKEQIKVEKY